LTLDIQLNDAKDLLAVNVDGDIDVNSVRELKKSLDEYIDENKPSIVVDCEKLNYIDSTGLGVLVSALKKVQKYDGTIKIIKLQDIRSDGIDAVI